MKAPFPYFGGKSRVAHLVWERFGDVRNYVEPFAGSLAVLLARENWENAIETVNDADCYLSNFWRATQFAADEVADHADWPVNEADLHARHNWLVNSESAREFRERMKSDPDYFDAKIAGWWVWGISQWIGSGWCAPSITSIKLPQKMPILGNYGVGVHSKTRLSQQKPRLSGGRGSAGQGIHADAFDKKTGGIYEYFSSLKERLRRVRVVCGDWSRITGPAVTTGIGITGVFLDPPYSTGECEAVYATNENIGQPVREWAIANGDNPKMRIALCGYEGEHEMPGGWDCIAWTANGGYGTKGNGRGAANRHRERIWFSPYCLQPKAQTVLF